MDSSTEWSQSDMQRHNLMQYKRKNQLHLKDWWILLLFPLLFLYTNSSNAGDNIFTRPGQWLESLSKEDQKIALINYQIRLGEKSNDILVNAKNANDRLWSAKILMCGYELATRFATKNKDQKEAMTFMADSLSDAIAGKGTAEIRKSRIDKAAAENMKIADSITKDAAASFDKRYIHDSESINKSLIVAAMLCASPDAIGKEHSSCNPKGTDVCKIARRMANDLAPQLPMQLSSQLSMQTVVAVKGNFLMTAKLEYDNAHLQSVIINSGVRNDEMIKIMHRHAKSGICQLDTPTKAFIDLGGIVSYQYRFNDGSMYTQVQIDTCS